MSTTYTASLRLSKPGVGDTNWGLTVNDGATDLTDSSIAGYTTVAMTDADYTLTSNNGSADEARSMMLNITGTLTAARNVICPTVSKLYFIKNSTTGGFSITIKTAAGSGISIQNGYTVCVFCNGTNVIEGPTGFTNIVYSGTLTGGTGVVNLGSGQFYKDASGNVALGTTTTTNAKLFSYVNDATLPGLGVRQDGAGPVQVWQKFGTELARIDASGNLGLGVTPSAWSGSTAVQIQKASVVGISDNAYFGANWYFDGTSNRYIASAASSRVDCATGIIQFNIAPSGTAGAAITFTQAMTLDASGNLLVGTTTTQGRLTVRLDSTTANPLYIVNAAISGVFAKFEGNGAVQGSITWSGSTTAYNTTSDRRLKTNIVDAPDASALIDSIKVRSFDWIADNSHQRYGMVAQELFEVAPEAVHAPADPVDMMAVDYSKLVPMLVKEIQSLRARVAALEAK